MIFSFINIFPRIRIIHYIMKLEAQATDYAVPYKLCKKTKLIS